MINVPLRDHLKFISERAEVDVPSFAQAFGLERNGVAILRNYVDSGLLERNWRRSRGVYALTDAGRQKLAEQEELAVNLVMAATDKKNEQKKDASQSNTSKQPSADGNAARSADGGAKHARSGSTDSSGSTAAATGKSS